ncbi:MAG TPA: copper chaperone PCu(A)C [Anaerolineae bacterium]|nr:copper chaperone PCu(A)C [Anaerolineae bacterium]
MNYKRLVICFLALLSIVALSACGASSGSDLVIDEVWARPAMVAAGAMAGSGGMGAAGTGAVFMRIANDTGEADRLVGGTTDVAQAVEIHETVMEGEVMRMQMLPQGLDIPAGGEVLLKPGSYHVMLIGMQRDLVVGDTFEIELNFEKAGSRVVTVQIREM